MSIQQFTNSDERWHAICRREYAADGHFYYGVITTGIFCCPSCPSRLPRRENLRFFTSAPEAQAAGFRPCKRCQPLTNADSTIAQRIALVCRQIETSEAEPGLVELAHLAGISSSHLQRQFKQITGISPKAYAQALRIQRLQRELASTDNLTQAIYAAGFGHTAQVYKKANQLLGMSPREAQHQGKNMMIYYALKESSLGWVLAAQTDKGVCAILLGDSPEALIQDLRTRFAHAHWALDQAQLNANLQLILAFIDRPHQPLSLPLDICGTIFQQRVWQALQEIPLGETRSYSEIAAAIGSPGAVRAVAGACAANKLALAIPCHRVVRNDGNLSGYRWGPERKGELLKREATQGKFLAKE